MFRPPKPSKISGGKNTKVFVNYQIYFMLNILVKSVLGNGLANNVSIIHSAFYKSFSSSVPSPNHQILCLPIFFRRFPDFGPYVQ